MAILLALYIYLHWTKTAESQSNNSVTDQSGELENLEAAERKIYDEWLSNQLVFRASLLVGERVGQCVVGAYKFLGITERSGYTRARDIPANSKTPSVGAIVKTNESPAGHLAVIIRIRDTTLVVFESNFGHDGRYGVREIPIASDKITGFIERR